MSSRTHLTLKDGTKRRRRVSLTSPSRLRKLERPLPMAGDPHFSDWLEHDEKLYAQFLETRRLAA